VDYRLLELTFQLAVPTTVGVAQKAAAHCPDGVKQGDQKDWMGVC